MNTEFLKELYESGYFSIHEKFDDWHDAIIASIQPLVDDNAVKSTYANSIIAAVNEYGPYICIAPDICLPHAQETGDVIKTAICFMKCNTPVIFDNEENHQSRLFFALASNNPDEHIANMKKLMIMLTQDEIIEALIEAKTLDDFESLIYK